MNAERAKEPIETEGEFEKRTDFASHWVRSLPIREAKWIWRAWVVIEAMGLFLGLSDTQHSKLKSGALHRFDPKAFYMYSWICLIGGRVVRTWGRIWRSNTSTTFIIKRSFYLGANKVVLYYGSCHSGSCFEQMEQRTKIERGASDQCSEISRVSRCLEIIILLNLISNH